MIAIGKETKLAESVVEWLSVQHWDVYQEVKFNNYGGIADIVAVRAGLLWIIECKTSLTFTVLEQAHRWQAHFRSVAIPKARDGNRYFAYHIANQHLHLGILEVDGINVIQHQSPPLMREFHKLSKQMISQLCEEHKTYAKAGSNYGGYYTPYQKTITTVKRFIATHPGCTLKEIMGDLGKNHHYASDQGARSSIRIALSEWEPWCRVENDKNTFRYFLKPEDRNG